VEIWHALTAATLAAAFAAFVSYRKGRSVFWWGLLAFLVPVVGVPFVLLMGTTHAALNARRARR
jgi:hypothetical protein